MRSSKSRSRSKTNRPRTLGNIINRVFDSSGPEGKVRGTPQQIIEKYQILARDAQLSNDRVAAENFMQHAEHYTRLLSEAMREMAAEQEARQQQQPQGGQQGGQGNGQQGGQQNGDRNRDYNRDQNQNRDQGQNREQPRNDWRGDRNDQRPDYRPEYRDDRSNEAPAATTEVIDLSGDNDTNLVETPETRQRPRRDDRRDDRRGERRDTSAPRSQPSTEDAAPPAAAETQNAQPVTEGAPEEGPKPRARIPRKPRGDKPKADGDTPDGKAEAAE